MNKTSLLTSLFVFLLVVSLASFVSAQEKINSEKIDSVVLQKLDQGEERIEVDVFLEGVFSGNPVSRSSFDQVKSGLSENSILRNSYPIGFSAELTRSEIAQLSNDPDVLSVDFRHIFKTTLEQSTEIVGAQDVWNKEVNGVNLRGAGQSVCVIDTGVDFTHSDLAGKNALSGNDNLNCLNGYPCLPNSTTTDLHGHGTHVAGTIAGNGVLQGVAPDTNVIGLKVFPANDGSGVIGIEIPAAVLWCIENKDVYNISVISMSLSTENPYSEGSCPNGALETVVDMAVADGISVVVATGNDGNYSAIGYPSCIPTAIPVGASDKSDIYKTSSNINSLVKLLAPGQNICSSKAAGTALGSDCVDSDHVSLSGTSMSTPHVSAAIAILNQYLGLTGASAMHPKTEIESLFYNTGAEVANLPAGADAKRININDAIMSITPAPGVSLMAPGNNDLLYHFDNPGKGNEHTFRCSVTDDIGIDQVELKIWRNHGDVPVYSDIRSFEGSTTSETVTFNVPRAEMPSFLDYLSVYTWDCVSSNGIRESDENRNTVYVRAGGEAQTPSILGREKSSSGPLRFNFNTLLSFFNGGLLNSLNFF